jgi:pyruvate formate lyase activating enzyme
VTGATDGGGGGGAAATGAAPPAAGGPRRGPVVVDVKHNSLDDGPGIRSVVFFKGCPLRCVWCQNPETLSPAPELQRDPDRCLGCGACVTACPVGVARPAGEPQPGPCRVCGACVAVCPPAARRVAGTTRTVADLVATLGRDAPFFRRSGGGVTFSGGEPALYPALAGQVAAGLAARGIAVLLETCGHFGYRAFARHLLPHLSQVYFDLKLADPEAHRRYCGRDNALILANLGRLAAAGVPLLPRIPLVPGITDAAENLRGLAAHLKARGLARVAILQYNPLWVGKRRALGLPLPYARATWMSPADVAAARAVLAAAGLEVVG